MNKKENFLVDENWYKAYVEQLELEKMNFEIDRTEIPEQCISRKIYSKKTGTLLCEARYFENSENNEFYIFSDPDKNETKPPQPKVRVVLNTKEQVQAFVDIYNKAMREKREHDRVISNGN